MTPPSRTPLHDAYYCGGIKRQGDGTETCTQRAGWGTDHVGAGRCKLHGGSSPSGSASGRLALAESEARRIVKTYGLKIDTTATEALLDEVQWTAGHVAWLRERVQEFETHLRGDGEDPAEIDPDNDTKDKRRRRETLVWGVSKVKVGGDDWGSTEQAGPNVWLQLYQAERTHLVKVCSEAIRCGIEERRVQIAQEQGAIVARLIRAILGDLQLTPAQQQQVPEIVPRHLRMVAG